MGEGFLLNFVLYVFRIAAGIRTSTLAGVYPSLSRVGEILIGIRTFERAALGQAFDDLIDDLDDSTLQSA